MFHTQEQRQQPLTAPMKSIRSEAWLGDGYYFWADEQDAYNWGRASKKSTGRFEIYLADIDCSDILDTVFNEEHYRFWLRQIEKTAKAFLKKTGHKPTIREINQYFKERGQWNEVSGILFQDLPQSPNYLMVIAFYYKKRIQLVAFRLEIVCGFALKNSYPC